MKVGIVEVQIVQIVQIVEIMVVVVVVVVDGDTSLSKQWRS